jgi:hypothetical protein
MSEITDAIIKELRAQLAGKEAQLAHGSSEAYLREGIDRLKRILAAYEAGDYGAAGVLIAQDAEQRELEDAKLDAEIDEDGSSED